ncbi:MAG: class I SAM-dependent methyltransferase [Candidatus Adlerbacteria bacterium]
MKKLNDWQAKQFLAKYRTDDTYRALDIGAGARSMWKGYFPNITTLDIAEEKKPDIVGDVHDLPIADGLYDIVMCSETFEHFHNPFRAATEIARILKPGGLLFITTRFNFPVHDAPHDYWRYTPYGLRTVLKDFEILEEGVEGDAFSTIAILLQRIMFQTKLRGGKVTKGLVYILALILNKLDPLIIERYGDIKRSEVVPVLLAAGVFVAARKKF